MKGARALAIIASVTIALLVAVALAPSASAGDAPSKLRVWVKWSDATPAVTWTLTCHPTGGTHPNAKRACATLDTMGHKAFAPLPAGIMCPMIYSGPEKARVTGVWKGKKIDARFSRTDGCQSARWAAYGPLLRKPA